MAEMRPQGLRLVWAVMCALLAKLEWPRPLDGKQPGPH